jgi:hypothetical protein
MSRLDDREILRVIRRLAARGAYLVRTAEAWRIEEGATSPRRRRGGGAIADTIIERMLARGLLSHRDDNTLALSEPGRASLRRHLAEGDGFVAQHQTRGTMRVDQPGAGRAAVEVNLDESPLAWLRRRKGKDGRPLVDAAEFAAGERLRVDYERGCLMPRVTANWTASVADARRDGGAGGIAELTEAALAARSRVNRALAAVGPEFAGVLVDFCCFLKGIEEIERSRQWPARSAKLVLRLALASLARHYGLSPEAHGRRGGTPLRHWGVEGYRPSLD